VRHRLVAFALQNPTLFRLMFGGNDFPSADAALAGPRQLTYDVLQQAVAAHSPGGKADPLTCLGLWGLGAWDSQTDPRRRRSTFGVRLQEWARAGRSRARPACGIDLSTCKRGLVLFEKLLHGFPRFVGGWLTMRQAKMFELQF
jgi:hypothetical protein